jgi:trans-aconitate methyltransferase
MSKKKRDRALFAIECEHRIDPMNDWGQRASSVMSRSTIVAEEKSFYFEILAEISRLKPKHVLSIGAGLGEVEAALMAKFENLQISLLEPDQALAKIASENTKHCVGKSRILTEKFQTFETNVKFDFIFAIHSWYYIYPNPEMIQKALSMLNPGGALGVVLKDQKSYTARLYEAVQGKTYKYITSEPLEKILQENSIPYQRLKKEELLDASIYFDGAEIRTDKRDWIGWMSDMDWNKMSNEQQESARAAMHEFKTGDKVISNDSLFLIRK